MKAKLLRIHKNFVLLANSLNVKIEPVSCDWNLTRFECKKQMFSIYIYIEMHQFLQKKKKVDFVIVHMQSGNPE